MSITFGGICYNQIRNAIYCKKCKDTIESKNENDFKMCSCGVCSIDGGIEKGNRILGNIKDIETRCMYVANINNKKFWLPKEVIEQNFRKIIFYQSQFHNNQL